MQDELFSMFTKTSAVKKAYKKHCASPDSIPYSIQDYLHVIEKYMDKQIVIREVDKSQNWHPKYLKGQIEICSDKAIILVPTVESEQGIGVTECERNFAVMKEAGQLLINHDSEEVVKITDLINSVISAGDDGILNEQPSLVKSEYIGEVAALEMLFPSTERDCLREQVRENKTSYSHIAHAYKIPEHQVMKALSDSRHPALESYRADWHDLLDEIAFAFEVKEIDVD